MKTRLFVLLVVAILALGACVPVAPAPAPAAAPAVAAASAAPAAPANTGAAPLGYKFVMVSHGSSGDPFHSVIKQGMEDAAARFGVQAQLLFSEGDNAKEVNLMEQAIAGNPDGIGISIVDPVAFDQVIQKAIDKGIPVIAFNNDDASTPNARLAYIGASEQKVGYTLGKYMQKFLAKGDKCVIPEEVPGMSYAVNRAAGIKKAMDEIGVSCEELDAAYERADTTNRISAYLRGHPEVKAVINVGGLTTEVAGTVVSDSKLQGKVVVGGFDLLPNTGPAIKSGITKAVIDQQPYLQGYYTIAELALMKYGKFTAFDIDTGRGIVDASNIDQVIELAKNRIR